MAELETADWMREFRKKILSRKKNEVSKLIHTEVDITLTARGIPEGSESGAPETNIILHGQIISISENGDLWLMSDNADVVLIPRYNIAYVTVIGVSPEYFIQKTSAPRVISNPGRKIPKQF